VPTGIGHTGCGLKRPRILKELPFLVSERKEPGAKEEKVGRVDLVLVSKEGQLLKWCGVEMQSVYFSGKGYDFGLQGDREPDRRGQRDSLPDEGSAPGFSFVRHF
jgi:hypothetical protein